MSRRSFQLMQNQFPNSGNRFITHSGSHSHICDFYLNQPPSPPPPLFAFVARFSLGKTRKGEKFRKKSYRIRFYNGISIVTRGLLCEIDKDQNGG
ncbi:hypothetical protein CEXT_264601 [Caerostris extrusa]|uniref:Uncharacterized protein n=1 Tax=Caerostris extrusa TaxID=172846 RepID=A0AAV4RI57_CAEEX|nr:hypothetical protein CEXT_264601 [Caerostris extrusa]